MNALWAVRILRKFPHTARFDRHLDDCAALAVWFPLFESGVSPLRLAHVLRLAPLPSLDPGFSDPMDSRVHIPEPPENVLRFRRKQKPEIFNGVGIVYNGAEPNA
ncbi:hypothetical protein RZS28_07300 [Methylocapsa polymorpha]|uniref:Uncharacterized protein n=1 Tax=Methylocapsa polymorpha TaxID=3080828 RepID=A0ABZ0HV33_9HYPH|nr:hypothetical protein RZS28_07300 [Methylocapsa sp. RX1]